MSRTILIMAGGTGGHIFPALAVAGFLRGKGWRVVWLGTRGGMEARLVPPHGYEMEWIRFSGVRRSGLLRAALLPLFLIIAWFQSAAAIFRQRPDVVLGMGGFASFPGGMMASLLMKPLVIHEQNSIAGLANRVLALLADKVLVAFPDPFRRRDEGGGRRAEEARGFSLSSLIPHPPSVEIVGNPVRPEIAALPEPDARYRGRTGPLRLLVVGGSLGAQALNAAVPEALKATPEAERPGVVHQTGTQNFETVKAAYARVGMAAEVLPFLNDMPERYRACDLVLCRAGALTIAEIAAAGVASILVPYPFAVDDHQTWNARFLSGAGAAVLLPQGELSPGRLAELIGGLDRGRLLEMARRARSLAKPDATQRVAEACMEAAA
ncbi:MAG: undecaprenyldiphospho-muramoylpentapeptide beta-N-acetylglucosaminyltransferase [Betaproteobacteria bacterium]|nr:undecaprenyldiphospho-muramoylpentapeptide beta-N-acetylglucosaminyltransferase [Betaproteobacteria bacterium]